MALNVCSINSFTINGFKCRDKFADLIPILHPPAPAQTIAGNSRVLRDTFKYDEKEIEQTLTFEQPTVSVTVEFLGSIGTDTQDVTNAATDFVTVSGLEFSTKIAVNITDLKFK